MTVPRSVMLPALSLVGLALALSACEPSSGPRTDSQTHWLQMCEEDADCSSLECVCGVCTVPCDAENGCAALAGASCIAATEPGAIAACGGVEPAQAGLCLPRCADGACDTGQMCVAEICSPVPPATVRVDVDTSTTYQTLIGFGATLAYVEREVLGYPRQTELFDAMFDELGLDILRIQNRYGYADGGNLASLGTIIDAATVSLGQAPTLMLTSWSPPAALKASGSTICQGDPDTCTLALDATGGFDYAGFAAHWRASLEAYADAGVVPDFIGIQNNPDFVPSEIAPGEGCRFLPSEGSVSVSVGGTQVDVALPGLDQALAGVVDALAGLASRPEIVAPEVSSVQSVAGYARSLDFSEVGALAHHLYGTDPNAADFSALNGLSNLAQRYELPLFQTEMESDGVGTTVLMHQALVTEGASVYLQSVLARPAASAQPNSGTLIALGADDFILEDPYHAMRHFALHTAPGWTRVEANSDDATLLASAWSSPDGTALTVILVNAGDVERVVTLSRGAGVEMVSQVTRSVFGGIERSVDLGVLPSEGVIRLPSRSIVTVAFRP